MNEQNSSATQLAEYSSPYRYVISFTAFFSQIALAMCLGCLSPLGPYIREALGMNFTQFGLLFTLSNAGTMVFLWITGPLVDRFGVRKIMVGGTVLMAAGLFAASLTTTATQLIVLQLCLGICNSTAGPTGTKMVSTWVGPKERSAMLGLKQAGIPVTSVIAGFALPLIATQSGWRTTYVVVSVFVLVVGILSGILYRDSAIMKESMSKGVHRPSFRENAPFIFKRDFILLSIGCLLMMGTQFALSGNMSNYCTGIFTEQGMENAAIVSGRIYSYACIGGIIGRLVFGVLADKFSSKWTLVGINVAAAVLLMILGVGGSGLGVVTLGLVMILYGATGFAWSGIQLGIATSMTPVKAAATTVSITLSFSFAGMMIFSPLFGSVVDAMGFSVGWYFLAAFTVLGVLFLLPIKDTRSEG